MEGYLQILLESLQKKDKVLDQIQLLEDQQAQLLLAEKVDMEAFDRLVDEKSDMTDELNRLDEGFQKTYELIHKDLFQEKDSYREQIRQLQECVSQVVEKGISIQTQENRLKQQLDALFVKEHGALKQKLLANKVARGYYNNMSRMNYIDPQLMDKKK